jgi:sugar phosphate isomerase/epimerase
MTLRIVLLLSLLFVPAQCFAAEHLQRTFFALCMDTHDAKKRSVEEQNAMLEELGFDGVAHLWLKGLPERVESAKKHHLKVVQVYFQINLAKNPAFDAQLEKVLSCLQGENVQLALLINGGKPSDASLDDKAVEVIQQIRRIADPLGVQVVLYPHTKAWLETVGDAVRLAKRFPDNKVGVMFNLCHWAAVDKYENLQSVLELAKPYLAAVTLQGTDMPEAVQKKTGNWIQPLDAGTFDIDMLLGKLDAIGYRGPVGLQCFGIGGDAREHLERSIKKWRSLISR